MSSRTCNARLRGLTQRRRNAEALEASSEFRHPEGVLVSAVTGKGLDDLHDAIDAAFGRTLQPVDLLVPYAEGGRFAELHDAAGDLEREETPEGVRFAPACRPPVAERFVRFAV